MDTKRDRDILNDFFKEKEKIEKKKENVLVVGGTGFIGYNFSKKIIKKNLKYLYFNNVSIKS